MGLIAIFEHYEKLSNYIISELLPVLYKAMRFHFGQLLKSIR
jgi:hypothetical protein